MLPKGYVAVTKVTEKGRRRGHMPLEEVADVLAGVYNWDAARRRVRMVSRLGMDQYLAFGQNGSQWRALKEIPPGEYYLVSGAPGAGAAHLVRLPRLVVLVGNYTTPHIWWTPGSRVTLRTALYPLLIGNVAPSGAVCLGNTGLRCEQPEDIDDFIRRVIEAPASGEHLQVPPDVLYAALAREWDPSIGRTHGITVQRLLDELNG